MRRLWSVPVVAGLLILASGCGDQAVDPYAAQRAADSYAESVADAQRWETIKTAFVAVLIVLLIAGVVLALMAGLAWVRRAWLLSDLVYPDAAGRLPFERGALTDPAIAASALAAYHQTQYRLARSAASTPTHYHNEVHTLPGPEPAQLPAGPDVPQLPAGLPGPCTLLEVMQRYRFQPDPQHILLGLGPGEQLITVPADDTMCHLLMAGRTGRGKSALFRLIMAQLLIADLRVYWLDPNFAPFDLKRKIDLRPLASRIGRGLLTDVGQIGAMFTYLAGPELTKRRAAKLATGDPGPAFYVFADEWPNLITLDKTLSTSAATCLRTYRAYDGYFAVGSQDGLTETMGLNSGELGQFGTLYYVGGADATTRKRLTGSTQTPDPMGKGLVYLSAAPLERPQEVRVPYVGNEDLYTLFGRPATPAPWEAPGVTTVDSTARPWENEPPATPAERPEPPERPEPDSIAQAWEGIQRGERTAHGLPAAQQEALAYRLWLQGVGKTKALELLYKVKRGGNKPWDEASALYDGWLANWQAGQVPTQEAA